MDVRMVSRHPHVANRATQGEVIMKVGFIGLGHMGSGMAVNLLKAGHQVTVYNRTLAKVESLVAQGAKVSNRFQVRV
jgi:6-phosphogluconate dehydrogenase